MYAYKIYPSVDDKVFLIYIKGNKADSWATNKADVITVRVPYSVVSASLLEQYIYSNTDTDRPILSKTGYSQRYIIIFGVRAWLNKISITRKD